MAKSELFHFPLMRFWPAVGAFPVRRGSRDEEAMRTARMVLLRGDALLIYCEGTRVRAGGVLDAPRTGVGRLALESGAPVVPVGISRIWIRGARKKKLLPHVVVEFGANRQFEVLDSPTYNQQRAAAREIYDDVHALLGNVMHGRLRRAPWI
jgi:1-acyl-sn-glycerol-3-phosphate acyltransferase